MAGQIWDCVVVGAGPAGAAAAALAQSGRRVLMIDRVEFPRPKACGGMLSVDAVRLLPFPVMPLCRGLVRQSLLKMPQDEVILPGRAFLVRRAEFDNAYRLFAISRGATFACKKGLVRIKQRIQHRKKAAGRARFPVFFCGTGGRVRGTNANVRYGGF
jgi:flavin-dependent dehydrogenase